MSVTERAEQAARETYYEYIARTAEAFELLLAALCLENGGEISVPQEWLARATGLEIETEQAEGGLVVRAASGVISTNLDGPQEPLGESASEQFFGTVPPATSEEEEAMSDTREGREQRYIERMQGRTQPARPAGVMKMRPWDTPDDLRFQDVVSGEQPERHSTELDPGDGSVQVRVR